MPKFLRRLRWLFADESTFVNEVALATIASLQARIDTLDLKCRMLESTTTAQDHEIDLLNEWLERDRMRLRADIEAEAGRAAINGLVAKRQQ